MEDRFEVFTVLIAKISRSIRRIKTEEMAKYDLKATHVNCLYYLYLSEGLTASALCERCEEDKAAISRSLEYLGKNGYLERNRSGGRRYRSALRLTEKGKGVARAIAERIDGLVEYAGEEICGEERTAMYRALSAICARLEKERNEEA